VLITLYKISCIDRAPRLCASEFWPQVASEKLLRGSKYAVDVPICLVAAGSAVAIRNQSPRVKLAQ
jgi:hypothetical protein